MQNLLRWRSIPLAKKEDTSKKQQLDSEIENAMQEKKQSRGLKSLGDLNQGQVNTSPQTASGSPKEKTSSPTKSLPQPPKKDLEMLQKQLKETKKTIVVMTSGTISLDLRSAETETKKKKREIAVQEAIFTLECQGMTSLIRLPPEVVRTILQALGLHV
jgi:hypothetical protein